MCTTVLLHGMSSDGDVTMIYYTTVLSGMLKVTIVMHMYLRPVDGELIWL